MRILPVLDLMTGQVVRGIGGRRQEYRPIASILASSAEPSEVARAFREKMGLDELYLADLDAIAGQPPALTVYVKLLQAGFQLWVDAGAGWAPGHAEMLDAVGVWNIIAGLESLQDPDELTELHKRFSARLVFSLDMKNGQPLGKDAWNSSDPWVIAHQAVELGVRRILVLDLASVGAGQGPATLDLCARLRSKFPSLEITTGGGIRGVDDLRALQKLGVDNVLVASALHDGRLTRGQIEEFQGKSRASEMTGSTMPTR